MCTAIVRSCSKFMSIDTAADAQTFQPSPFCYLELMQIIGDSVSRAVVIVMDWSPGNGRFECGRYLKGFVVCG